MRFALLVTGSMAALSARGCSDCAGSAPSNQATQAAIDEATKTIREVDEARRHAIGEARTAVRPSASGAPCPEKFDPIFARVSQTTGPDLGRPDDKTKKAWGGYDVPHYDASADDLLGGFADELCAIDNLGIEYVEEAADKPGPRAVSLRSALRRTPSDWEIKDLLDMSRHAVDYELVIDAEIPPKLVTGKTFEPGFLKGRFFVWDNRKRTIVCTANVFVESSDALEVEYNGPSGTEKAGIDLKAKSGLVSDLREQALAQAKKLLVAVEPGPQAPAPEAAPSGSAAPATSASSRASRDAGHSRRAP